MDPLSKIATMRHWSGRSNVRLDALPMAQLSFSMAGEDVVLAHHFKRRIRNNQPGIYVDIGCAMPVQVSNTYLFYCLGWRGVGVDMNNKHEPLWASARPEDIFVHAAVSDQEKEAYVFNHSYNDGMPCIAFTPDPPDSNFKLSGKINTTKLSEILARHFKPGTQIDFFSIDVESSEMGVLKSNDWSLWAPAFIMMECKNINFNSGPEPESVTFLRDVGYSILDFVSGSIVLGR